MVGPGWAWPGWAVPGGFLGERWALGALWWCLGRLRMEMRGVCGARSGLADVWVMHRMVMDETLHVFPGGGMGALLRVC